jgi:hypothetical protein
MFDFFGNLGSSISNFDYSKFFDGLDKYTKPLALAGGIWSGYNQQKMAKKQFDLQKDAYNYNKMLSEENRKRRDDVDKAFNLGFGNG